MELLLPLVCLCLLSCSGDGVRVVVKQDSDAVLPCSANPKVDLRGNLFDWKKGQKEVFMYAAGNKDANRGQDGQFIGRVSHFQDQLKNGDASMKITRTKMADSGTYSCIFPRLSQTFNLELVVGAAPEPNIRTLDETNHWRLLQCEAHGLPPLTVEWKDSAGNTLPAEEPQISERGGLSYVTVNVTVTKTGTYSCVATQVEISHQIPAATYVRLTGAASKPSVTTLKTDDGTVLQCEVLGASPKPKVEWKDSSGNILPVKDLKETERGDSYDIVLQAALTKTDNFRCVVTQEEINHHIYAESYANINGLSAGVIAAIVVLILLLVGGAVGCGLCIKKKNEKIKRLEQRDSTQNSRARSDPEPTTTDLLNP